MKITELLTLQEIGDRKIKFTTIRNDDRVFDVEATIGSRKIEFSAVYVNSYWNVVFSEAVYDQENDEWNSSIDATGSGNEFQVLSLVMTCMKELLKKNPRGIKFTADKRGSNRARASIYRKLADRLLKGFEREESDDGREVEFRYSKPMKDIEL